MNQVQRLKVLAAVLTTALLTALAVGGVVVYRYQQQRAALVSCYGVANAGVFYIVAAQSEHEGFMDTAKAQREGGDAALAKLGEDSLIEAMERCDYAMWVN